MKKNSEHIDHLVKSLKKDKKETYDFSNLNLEGLLYETGYLTIKEYDKNKNFYTLGCPNQEVKNSLVKRLLYTISEQRSSELLRYSQEISAAFMMNNDIDTVFYRVNTILSEIPHQLFSRYEGHYHSLIHLIFEYAGVNLQSESTVSGGDSDMIVEMKNSVYILGFKLKHNKGIKGAFAQIENRGYTRKFEAGTKDST